MLCRFVSFLPLVLLSSLSGRADKPEPWNQFRGPNGSGIRSDARIHLPDKNNLLWQAPLPLRPFLTRPFGGQDFPHRHRGRPVGYVGVGTKIRQTALEETSSRNGNRKISRIEQPGHPHPRLSTRTGSSFILVPSGFFVTIDEGKRFGKSPSPPPRAFMNLFLPHLTWGSAHSGGRRRRQLAQQPGQPVSHPSKERRGNRMETPRPFHRSGWSTPTIWEHDRGKELVVLGNGSLRGYTLPEGEEKWQVDGFSRETIARPMVGNGLVFASGSKLGGQADLKTDHYPFGKRSSVSTPMETIAWNARK